jgi:peptidyl-prolyl cis-trans isomerase C
VIEQATPANFGDLARQLSQDPGSARNGGDLGTRPASAFVPPFARALVEAEPGQIVGPVQTEFGFHVIHVIDRQLQPFEAVRPQLVGELRGRVFTEWLLERVGLAEIQVNPRYGFFDEDSGTVIERRSTSPAPRRSPQVAP